MPMEEMTFDGLSYFERDVIAHHGIKGQKWGVRRFQNADGTYTKAGKARKSKYANMSPEEKKAYKEKAIKIGKAALGITATAALVYGANKYMTKETTRRAGEEAIVNYMNGPTFKKQYDQMMDYRKQMENASTSEEKVEISRKINSLQSRIDRNAEAAQQYGEKHYKAFANAQAKKSRDDAIANFKKNYNDKKKQVDDANKKVSKTTGKILKTTGKIAAAGAVVSQLDESRKAIAKAKPNKRAKVSYEEAIKVTKKVNNLTNGGKNDNNGNNGNKNNNSGNVSTFDGGVRSNRQLTKEEKKTISERVKNGEDRVKVMRQMGVLDESSVKHSYVSKFEQDVLVHHGIRGQHWGRRRFQNEDGSLTPEGERRYTSKKEYKSLKSDYRSAKREATRAKSIYKTTKKYGSKIDQGRAKADYGKAKGSVKDAKRRIKESDVMLARRKRRNKALLVGAAALGAAAYGGYKYVNKEHAKLALQDGRKARDAFRNSDHYNQTKDYTHAYTQKKIRERQELADSYGKLHSQSRKNLRTLGVGDQFFAGKKKDHLKKMAQYSDRERKVNKMLESQADDIYNKAVAKYSSKRFTEKAKDVYRDKRKRR